MRGSTANSACEPSYGAAGARQRFGDCGGGAAVHVPGLRRLRMRR